eukprot:7632844-Alexandrium_andersonii.AAC.1
MVFGKAPHAMSGVKLMLKGMSTEFLGCRRVHMQLGRLHMRFSPTAHVPRAKCTWGAPVS